MKERKSSLLLQYAWCSKTFSFGFVWPNILMMKFSSEKEKEIHHEKACDLTLYSHHMMIIWYEYPLWYWRLTTKYNSYNISLVTGLGLNMIFHLESEQTWKWIVKIVKVRNLDPSIKFKTDNQTTVSRHKQFLSNFWHRKGIIQTNSNSNFRYTKFITKYQVVQTWICKLIYYHIEVII